MAYYSAVKNEIMKFIGKIDDSRKIYLETGPRPRKKSVVIVLFSYDQRRFLLQQMGANKMIHRQTIFRNETSWSTHHCLGCLYLIPPVKAQEHSEKKEDTKENMII